jgi:uncharacterized protein YciI
MLYVIHTHDSPNSAAGRKAHREEHLGRLDALQREGRLVLAGPMPVLDAPSLEAGASGSLIVAAFDSLEAAKAWFAQDVFVRNGIYADWEIRPFIQARPA